MNIKTAICFLTLFITCKALSTPPSDEGKRIFVSRCASCHNVNKLIVGPALAGVSDRHTEVWIAKFIQSSQSVIKSGDKAAAALYEKFNRVAMPDHADLTAQHIKDILAYIKTETKTGTEIAAFRPEKLHPYYTPVLLSNWQFFAGFGTLVILLAAALILLVRVKEIQRKELKKPIV